MPTPTYTLIASSTVGSGGAASINFTSIPGTYTDLLVKATARLDVNNDWMQIRFNNDNTTGNYFTMRLNGTGSSVAAANSNNYNYANLANSSTSTSSVFSSAEFYIPNYAGSNQKSLSNDSVTENNATSASTLLNAERWTGTAAISRIDVYADTGSFVQYSSFYLYGIVKS